MQMGYKNGLVIVGGLQESAQLWVGGQGRSHEFAALALLHVPAEHEVREALRIDQCKWVI